MGGVLPNFAAENSESNSTSRVSFSKEASGSTRKASIRGRSSSKPNKEEQERRKSSAVQETISKKDEEQEPLTKGEESSSLLTEPLSEIDGKPSDVLPIHEPVDKPVEDLVIMNRKPSLASPSTSVPEAVEIKTADQKHDEPVEELIHPSPVSPPSHHVSPVIKQDNNHHNHEEEEEEADDYKPTELLSERKQSMKTPNTNRRDSTKPQSSSSGPVDFAAVRNGLKKTSPQTPFHARRMSTMEQRRASVTQRRASTALLSLPQRVDEESSGMGSLPVLTEGISEQPTTALSPVGAANDGNTVPTTTPPQQTGPSPKTSKRRESVRPKSLEGLDEAILTQMSIARQSLVATIGDQIPACGRCGHPLDKGQKITTSGMNRYHEICPSAAEIAAIIRNTRYFTKKLPERLVCAIEFGPGDGHVFSFIYDVDWESWDLALSQGNHDTVSVLFVPDAEAHAGIIRKFAPESFPPVAIRTVDMKPREFLTFTFFDPRIGETITPKAACGSGGSDNILEVSKWCHTNGVLITLKASYRLLEDSIEALQLTMHFCMCVLDEDAKSAATTHSSNHSGSRSSPRKATSSEIKAKDFGLV